MLAECYSKYSTVTRSKAHVFDIDFSPILFRFERVKITTTGD